MLASPAMTPTLILIHGGQMGAWAYDRLIPRLRQRGVASVAVDLPNSDPTIGADGYVQVILDRLASIQGEIVLVGHSMAGLIIPIVASRRPVQRLVFVCAGYPEPGRSHLDVRSSQPGEGVSPGPAAAWHQVGDVHMLPPEQARELFFDDCDPDVQDWAIARMRPQARLPLREVTPLHAWPDTPRTLIIASDDRCIPRELAIRTAERLFGQRPTELPGGHCPAISRPAALASLLVDAIG